MTSEVCSCFRSLFFLDLNNSFSYFCFATPTTLNMSCTDCVSLTEVLNVNEKSVSDVYLGLENVCMRCCVTDIQSCTAVRWCEASLSTLQLIQLHESICCTTPTAALNFQFSCHCHTKREEDAAINLWQRLSVIVNRLNIWWKHVEFSSSISMEGLKHCIYLFIADSVAEEWQTVPTYVRTKITDLK